MTNNFKKKKKISPEEKGLIRSALSAYRLSKKWGLNKQSELTLITASVQSFLINNKK